WEVLPPRSFNPPLELSLAVEPRDLPPRPFRRPPQLIKRFPRFLRRAYDLPPHHRVRLVALPPAEGTEPFMTLLGEVLRTQAIAGLGLIGREEASANEVPIRWRATRRLRDLSDLAPERLGPVELRWLSLLELDHVDGALAPLAGPQLEALELGRCAALDPLALRSLAECPLLCELRVWQCGVGGEALRGLSELQALSHLELRGCTLEAEALAELPRLADLEGLEALWLEEAPPALLESLARLPRLRELALDGAEDEDLAPLRALTGLRFLLAPEGLGDEGLAFLPAGLEVLQLRPRSSLSPAGVLALRDHPTLREVWGLEWGGALEAQARAFADSRPERVVHSRTPGDEEDLATT
ncbi:MAG TPA: hypothetical protein DEA08_35120, partial [Planctomycetes bacterium]|nr:hypothetical protein [Planctomycetota bacterium]